MLSRMHLSQYSMHIIHRYMRMCSSLVTLFSVVTLFHAYDLITCFMRMCSSHRYMRICSSLVTLFSAHVFITCHIDSCICSHHLFHAHVLITCYSVQCTCVYYLSHCFMHMFSTFVTLFHSNVFIIRQKTFTLQLSLVTLSNAHVFHSNVFIIRQIFVVFVVVYNNTAQLTV